MSNTATENLNLYQKLAKIRAMSDVVQKDKKGFNYKYTDIAAILANVSAGMKKYGVSLIPMFVHGTTNIQQNVTVNTKFKKNGDPYDQTATEMLVSADMIFRWVNDENPSEVIDVPWFLTGSQTDPSQAAGSGLTYTMRQFMVNYFQIAQPENDVDAYRTRQKEAEAEMDRAVVEGIVNEIDALVKSYMGSHPDDKSKAAIKELVSRYVKGGNYFNIKEPLVASTLLDDLKASFDTTTEERKD